MPGVDACQGEARGRAEALRVGRRGGRLEVGGRAVEGHVVVNSKKAASDSQSYFKSPGATAAVEIEKAGSILASASLAYVCGLGGPYARKNTRKSDLLALLASVLQAASPSAPRLKNTLTVSLIDE